MSPEEAHTRLIEVLKGIHSCLDPLDADSDCLKLELNEAEDILQKFELRPKLSEGNYFDVVEALRNRVVVHTIMGGNQVALSSHERDSIVRAVDLLITALEPFTTTRAPSRYPNDATVQLEVTATRQMAQEWATEWEMRARAGKPPPWKKPDMERGMDYPVEILNLDGVRIGDIRYAQSVLLSLKPISPIETTNVAV